MSDEAMKHTGDRIAAIVMLVVTGVVAAALAFAGLMLVMSSDSCGSGDAACNTGLFTIAWLLAMAFPIAGFTGTAVFTFVQIGRGERAVWVPLIGLLIYGAGFVGSVALAFAAVS